MRLLKIIQKQPVQEESPLKIDASRMIEVREASPNNERIKDRDGIQLCGLRTVSEFSNGAIWLSNIYDWEFGTDSEGATCAVPLLKK